MEDADGLYFMRARFYDPTVARFLTKDPVQGKFSDAQGLHEYVYCVNNPLVFTDALGTFQLETFRRGLTQVGMGTISFVGGMFGTALQGFSLGGAASFRTEVIGGTQVISGGNNIWRAFKNESFEDISVEDPLALAGWRLGGQAGEKAGQSVDFAFDVYSLVKGLQGISELRNPSVDVKWGRWTRQFYSTSTGEYMNSVTGLKNIGTIFQVPGYPFTVRRNVGRLHNILQDFFSSAGYSNNVPDVYETDVQETSRSVK